MYIKDNDILHRGIENSKGTHIYSTSVHSSASAQRRQAEWGEHEQLLLERLLQHSLLDYLPVAGAARQSNTTANILDGFLSSAQILSPNSQNKHGDAKVGSTLISGIEYDNQRNVQDERWSVGRPSQKGRVPFVGQNQGIQLLARHSHRRSHGRLDHQWKLQNSQSSRPFSRLQQHERMGRVVKHFAIWG